jgi:hypothetical protein
MKAKKIELIHDKNPDEVTRKVNERLAQGWDFLPGFKANAPLTKIMMVVWLPREQGGVEISREAGPAAS